MEIKMLRLRKGNDPLFFPLNKNIQTVIRTERCFNETKAVLFLFFNNVKKQRNILFFMLFTKQQENFPIENGG